MHRFLRVIAASAGLSLIAVSPWGALAVSSSPAASLAWFANGTKITNYDFGSIASGTKSQTFTLTNSGGAASGALKVTLTVTGSSGGFTKSSDNCTGKSLGPANSCSVNVKYAFTAPGQSDTATLTAATAKTGMSAAITLTGRSTGSIGSRCTGPWTIAPGQCLGNLNGVNHYVYFFTGDGTQTFTLTNKGTTTVNTGWAARSMSGLSVTSDTCGGGEVQPGQSCQITFGFTAVSCPDAIGFADWNFQGNGGPGQLADLQLTGPCS